MFRFPAQTDSRLPTGRQGESECGLGRECVGSPSGLRGRHRMAQVRQDEEIMQPRRGVLVSSSVPSIHYMVTTQDDQQYLAVNVTGCCAMIRQIQSLPFSEPLDAASRAKSIWKRESGTNPQQPLLHAAFWALTLVQVTGQSELSTPGLPCLSLTSRVQPRQNPAALGSRLCKAPV